MCKQHLHLLALVSGLFGCLGACQGAGDITGILINVAGDLALRRLWTAGSFQRTVPTVASTGKVDVRSAFMDPAGCLEVLALRADVDAAFAIPGKVSP